MSAEAQLESANQQTVRRDNLGLVLRQVFEHGPVSRSTIAQATGLNKTTVSSLISELVAFGLLAETGEERLGRPGRPGLLFEVARGGVVALGLEVNVDYLSVRAISLAGVSRYAAFESVDNRHRGVTEVLDRLVAMATEALAELGRQKVKTLGATLAVPGIVDVVSGAVRVAPNLQWRDVPVLALLQERIDPVELPLAVDNEGNLAALAELWRGRSGGCADFVYASGQIGVGGGIVIGRRLIRGSRGIAGELGHVTVEVDGLRCSCGARGCLETRAGLEHVLDNAGLWHDAGSPGGIGLAVELLRSRAQDGDAKALASLTDCGQWLGVALGGIVNVLGPRAIILGGHFAPMTDWLAPAIANELRTRVVAGGEGVPSVIRSRLGLDAAVWGGAVAQLQRVLTDPTIAVA